MSAAAFPAGTPAEVGDYLGRYRTRYYANGYTLTYEFAVAVEDEAAGLRSERRVLASEALGDDVVPLAGVPTWVVTRSANPDSQPISEHPEARQALAAYETTLAAQAVE